MKKTWAEVYDGLGMTRADVRFWQRLARPAPARLFTEAQEIFIMGSIAYHSGALESAAWDRWELHRDALLDAYRMGRERKPVTIYHFLKWHGAILPFGGTLRQSEPVSVGMGESFAPVPVPQLTAAVNAFVRTWCEQLDERDPLRSLAQLHFSQWRMHPYPDGNKRHARLMTTYGCGWLNVPPVIITLSEKARYLDALANQDIDALAALFKACQVIALV